MAEKKKKEYVYEPWGAQTLFVEKVLGVEGEEKYIANWSPKQIKFLAQMRSIIDVIKQYIVPNAGWLETLIDEYMKLSKFEDGWVIKQAKDVARAGTTRMMLNVARWKRIVYGEEPDLEETL